MLYSIKDNGIYKHNVYDKYTTYYGDFKGIIIDFVATIDQNYFEWLECEIFTDASAGYNRNRNVTFNKIGLVNSWQSMGYMDLNVRTNVDSIANVSTDKIVDKTTSIDLTRLPNSFRFNEVFDYTVDHNSPSLMFNECNPLPVITNYGRYIDRSDQTYTGRIVKDNYQYYRFIFDTFADYKLYIKKIDTLIDRKPR